MPLKKILDALSGPVGVTGREERIRHAIQRLKPVGMYEEVDHIGNLIWTPHRSPKVMFTAHMDEIGLIVSGHTDEGMLEFKTIGGWDDRNMPNSNILFENGKKGIIGLPAPHGRKDLDKVLGTDDLRIDAGYTDKEKAQEAIPVGTTAVIDLPHFMLNKHVYVSRNTDNRSGCACLVKLAHMKLNAAFIFTVQEECGLYGARSAMERFKDAQNINMDVTNKGELGKGVVVNIKDGGMVTSSQVIDRFREMGASNFEVTDGGTSDHTMMQFTHIAGGLGIPSRHIHSSVSKVSLDDMKDAVDLAAKFTRSLS